MSYDQGGGGQGGGGGGDRGPRYEVLAFKQANGQTYPVKCGSAYRKQDDSMVVFLDAIPAPEDGQWKLTIQLPRERGQGGGGGRGGGGGGWQNRGGGGGQSQGQQGGQNQSRGGGGGGYQGGGGQGRGGGGYGREPGQGESRSAPGPRDQGDYPAGPGGHQGPPPRTASQASPADDGRGPGGIPVDDDDDIPF